MKAEKLAIRPKSSPNLNSCSIKPPTVGLLYNDFVCIRGMRIRKQSEPIVRGTQKDTHDDHLGRLMVLRNFEHLLHLLFKDLEEGSKIG